MMKSEETNYKPFERALFRKLLRNMGLALLIIFGIYYVLWKNRGGDWFVYLVSRFFRISKYEAYMKYHYLLQNNETILFILSVTLTFFILLMVMLRSFMRYFEMINSGINALLSEDEQRISLVPELLATEDKLNTVKATLSDRKRDIETANQRKDDMILYLAHDIRTPLTSVIGYLDLLTDGTSSGEDQKKYLSIARNKAARLEELIEEFFQIAKARSLSNSFDKQDLDLILLLRQIYDELYPSLMERTLLLQLESPDSLQIYANPLLLMRALTNLLKNAASYAPVGSTILLDVSVEDGTHQVHIHLQNGAPYMDSQEVSRLFEKFYRQDPSRSSRTGGSGLGLPIAREIIEMHDGTIDAYYSGGKLHFQVNLPL